MATLQDIGVAALINIGLTLLFLLSFVFLSLQPVNDRVYFPKLYIKGVRKGRPRVSPRQLKPIEKYFNLDFSQYTRLFEWAKSALRKNENDIIQHAGLDSAVYLRIFLVGLKIFIPLMILGMTILVPVNVGAGSLTESGTTDVNANTTETKFLFSSIDKLSMSNVPSGSPRLWAHLVMAYVFTAWVCFILFMEYKSIAALRLRFLSDETRRPDQFTVMVLHIPDKVMQPLSKEVENFFLRNHPDYYLTHEMAYNANKLSKIVKERDKAQNWLDYFQLKHKRNPVMRPMTKTGFCGIFGHQVDAMDYYTALIERLNQEAEAERDVVINDPKATMPAAFVSFRTRWGAAVCAQTQQTQDPTLWLTDWAPEPRDVYWANLAIPYVQLGFRKLAVTGIVFLTVFFYMIPIAGVQSLANLEGLRRSIPALDGFLQKAFIASFVQGFLPGLVLKICFLLLPVFIMFITKLEGHLSVSKLERRAAAKYYYFVVVNIFFGSILTGSAFQQLKTFVTSSSILGFLNTLALSIPQKASFFITYIMVDGWSGPAGEILRLTPLMKYHIKNSLFCRTEKDRLEATSPGTLTLDETLPQLQLYFLMGLVYSVITPVIIPFIIIFMGFGFVVYRHQVINVYDPVYESAGAFWPHVHGRIIAALILEHLTLIGLFLVKGPISFVQTTSGPSVKDKILRYVRDSCSSTPFMIALPILTLVFHNYCKKRFEAAFTNYPIENAMEKDTTDKREEPDLNLAVFLRNAYNHPDFSDEKDAPGADVEKGQEEVNDIEEDDNATLQDSLPARAENEFVEPDLDTVEEQKEELDSSPLAFKWGAFNQAAEDDRNQGLTMSNPLLQSLSREPSDIGPPLTFNRGYFSGEGGSSSLRRRSGSEGGSLLTSKGGSALQEDNVEELRRDSVGRYHSARGFFDSASSRSNLDSGIALSDSGSSSSSAAEKPTIRSDDSSNELARMQSLQRYLQGQLSRENSFVEPLRGSDETARLASLQSFLRGQLSRESSFAEGASVSECDEAAGITNSSRIPDFEPLPALNSELCTEADAEKALLRDLQRYLRGQMSRENSFSREPLEDEIDEEALRTAYLQGYLRGQLSRENSSSESSPLIFSRRSPSHKDGNETSEDNLTGSPFTFRRGVLYESDIDNSEEIISASYLQGYVKGQLSRENSLSSPSFSDSPGSPLTFTTGRFGQYVDSGERTSTLGGSSNQRALPRAQTMSTIRESSEMVSDSQRGQISRSNTSQLAKEGANSPQKAGVVPAALAEVSQPKPAYSRAKTLGSLREVIYLDSPSFGRPNLARSKTLATHLREPQDTTGSSSSKGLRQRKVEKEKLRTGSSSSSSRTRPITRPKTLDTVKEAESEASTADKKSKHSRGNTLGNLMQIEPQEQPSTIVLLQRKAPSTEKKKKKKKTREDNSSSSSSSSSSTSSSSSSSEESENDRASHNPSDLSPEGHISVA